MRERERSSNTTARGGAALRRRRSCGASPRAGARPSRLLSSIRDLLIVVFVFMFCCVVVSLLCSVVCMFCCVVRAYVLLSKSMCSVDHSRLGTSAPTSTCRHERSASSQRDFDKSRFVWVLNAWPKRTASRT